MLQEKIEQDLIAAMKAGEAEKRDTLRLLKSALKNQIIELGKDTLSDEEVITVIGKEVKKRKESILAYQQVNKPELAESEGAELKILEQYLPAQMDEATIRQHVKTYLANNPTDPSQIGKTMGALSAELKGKADLGLVSRIVREELGASHA